MSAFSQKTGPMAIATRMRLLSERMSKESEKIFALYNVDIKPKWYPVLFCLMQEEGINSVTAIAKEVNQSHVAIVKIVKEMLKAGLITEKKDEKDKRKSLLSLSKEGQEVTKNLLFQHEDVTHTMDEMLAQTSHNLWLALDEFEALLDERSTFPRVVETMRKREAKDVSIKVLEPEQKSVFKHLNEAWIKEHFSLEEQDLAVLQEPEKYVLGKGGTILTAFYKNEPVGVCALIPTKEASELELSKMAVAPTAQNKGIGLLLVKAVIEQAKDMGAKTLFLETSTQLVAAIKLYKKVGFKQIRRGEALYARTNYQMQLVLK